MKANRKSNAVRIAAVAATVIWSQHFARAGTSTNTAGPVQQGQSNGGTSTPSLNNPAVTISFSGQTALKNFFISPALTELQPGSSIILHDGTNNAGVTYTATNDAATTNQLASKSFVTPDKNPGTPSSPSTSDIQIASALRIEWHQEGSIDGFVDLLNDQVGYVQTGINVPTDTLSQEALRGPSSSNNTIVNQSTFTAASSTANSAGFALAATTGLSQTYNTAVYNQATGANIQGGQNRVQFSIGEFPTEALAYAGTASPFAKAGTAGYGQGNTTLTGGTSSQTLAQLGGGNSRQQFQPTAAANESTDKDDPNTDSVYASGPWNTAGANNITSTGFAVTAVTYSANPGTGLQRIDLGDSQWLQTTGRLQNGALFNTVARTVNTGQRAVFALNTGIDPTWAVGSNDDGNSTNSTNAALQHSIGSSLRYDGKTSGSEAAATISASRMAVGALSVPEARTNSAANAPVRALDVDFTDQTDINTADDPLASNKFVRATFDSIVSDGVQDGPHYAATLISHVNTVKAPNPNALLNEEIARHDLPSNDTNVSDATNASLVSPTEQLTAWSLVNSFDPATAETDSTPATAAISGIKGDVQGVNGGTPFGGDVAAVISNVVNSTGTAAAGVTTASANNPADGLFATGFLVPGLLDYTRTQDGDPISPVTLSTAAQNEQNTARGSFGTLFTTDGTPGANANTIGTTSFYGASANGLTSNGVAINGAIPITAKNSSGSAVGNGTLAPAGNYLFGNFNQNGVRDFAAVKEAVNAALSLYAADGNFTDGTHGFGHNSIFTSDGGYANSQTITSLDTNDPNPGWVQTSTNTKGDLIVVGDFNGDGKFDGQDIYLLAIGASLAQGTRSSPTDPGSNANLTAAETLSPTNTTYTTFSDDVRNPNAVLRKNDALDWINNVYLNSTNNPEFFTVGTGGLSPAAFLRQTGRAVLTVPSITTSLGATALGATAIGPDPITGYEQFTFDPSGTYAFDKHDVNRDGVVDFNDGVLVDKFAGQSYGYGHVSSTDSSVLQNSLAQNLAATQQTPVSGSSEPLSLVDVQQIDGEASIGAADLTELNAGLAVNGPTNWYAYTLGKTGSGTINFGRTGGTVTVFPTSSGTGPATFQISGGQVNVGKTASGTVASGIDPFTDSSSTGSDTSKSVALTVTGGTLDYAARTGTASDTGIKTYKLNSLNIQSGGQVVLDSATSTANRSLLVVGQLSATGTLNLGANDLVIHNGNLAAITSDIAQGHGSGSTWWTGTSGITSSAAAAASSNTALGVELNSDGTPSGTLRSSFDGQTVTNTDVLVKYTFAGDADLSGTINAADYTLIDNGFNSIGALTGWRNGDFNYDGAINGDDYTLIDNAYNTQGTTTFSAIAQSAQLIATDTSQISTAVPEPTGLAVFTIFAAGLAHRRRRRASW